MCITGDHRFCSINNSVVSEECPFCRASFVIGCCCFVYMFGREHKAWILTEPLEVESTDGVILLPDQAEIVRSRDGQQNDGTVKI